jgi:uncharacterized membrane-anchored protein
MLEHGHIEGEPDRRVPEAPSEAAAAQTVTVSTGPTVMEPRQNWTMTILALLVFLGFFAVLGILAFKELPPSANSTISVLLGTLTAGVSTILSYYFGSSVGSSRKTELLSQEKR